MLDSPPMPASPLHAAVRRVIDAAERKGVTLEVTVFAESTHTAEDAAKAVGAELGQIVKSLVFMADDRPVILSELHADQLARVSGRTADAFLSELRKIDYRAFRVEGGGRGAELAVAPSDSVCSVALVPAERAQSEVG